MLRDGKRNLHRFWSGALPDIRRIKRQQHALSQVLVSMAKAQTCH
jgi:anionic cell wall polymer biosynthesis LytR-Cps2A-Psr (LCP) family protein